MTAESHHYERDNEMNRLALRVLLLLMVSVTAAHAQSVCLPAPRLLTTVPMGGKVDSTFDVVIAGDNIEEAEQLSFSHPGITATYKLEDGVPIPGKYVVTIAADVPLGIHEARVMTRLGVSASRAFNVGSLPETTRTTSNTSLATAMPLRVNSVCNAVMTKQAVDYFSFHAKKGQRIIVDCAARGVDSKLKPVVIIGDETGADLKVERRGGAVDFSAPGDGTFVIKVHDLTYEGGPYHFYRLVLREAKPGAPIARVPSTRSVSSFSWPPAELDGTAAPEAEPNDKRLASQKINLPCDISGSFFPAADVDTFEFTAKKGEVWWIEVASERLGLPTNPAVVVQHVAKDGPTETLTDVVELNDIASPIKVSTNGYSYNGPPYNAGSTDVLGKLEIKQDGVHRLRLQDLFGGTRNDPRNIYRLVIRKAAPDFAIVGWSLHMNLRNGDRNALSKPLALRRGSTMAIEVLAVRRDGFNGEIELSMDNLPPGVSAHGVSIPAGKSRGIMLLTADENASRGMSVAKFVGRATVGGKVVTRPGHFASMVWPVPDAKREIPAPRLLADVMVSVSDSDPAPITIKAPEDKVWEVTAGQSLTIPLVQTRRCKFSGANISLKTFGVRFDRTKAFNASLTANESKATLDTKTLKIPPGDYVVAFYGSAVAKYQHYPKAIELAEAKLKEAQSAAASAAANAKKAAAARTKATGKDLAPAQQASKAAQRKKVLADATVRVATRNLAAVKRKSSMKDIVDIVVSRPITVRVKPAEKK